MKMMKMMKKVNAVNFIRDLKAMAMRMAAAYLAFFSVISCKTIDGTQNTTLQSSTTCPKVDLGETPEDCPWAAIARRMETEIPQLATFESILRSESVELLNGIMLDSQNATLRKAWGESINFDEFVGKQIIPLKIIKPLLALASLPAPRGPAEELVHAGFEHTYGYLFSNLKTSFGYKRARWVRRDIANGLALPQGIVGPTPPQGTLLTNITYLFAKIAFRYHPEYLSEFGSWKVPQELATFNLDNYEVKRLTEEIALPPSRTVKIISDFVKFKIATGSNSHLIVYSIDDSSKPYPQLISGFPVATDFVNGLIAQDKLGPNKPIKTRYNAFVEGVTNAGNNFIGSRTVSR